VLSQIPSCLHPSSKITYTLNNMTLQTYYYFVSWCEAYVSSFSIWIFWMYVLFEEKSKKRPTAMKKNSCLLVFQFCLIKTKKQRGGKKERTRGKTGKKGFSFFSRYFSKDRFFFSLSYIIERCARAGPNHFLFFFDTDLNAAANHNTYSIILFMVLFIKGMLGRGSLCSLLCKRVCRTGSILFDVRFSNWILIAFNISGRDF
jgi:hypothetical protein